jgi:hypothetical protein
MLATAIVNSFAVHDLWIQQTSLGVAIASPPLTKCSGGSCWVELKTVLVEKPFLRQTEEF